MTGHWVFISASYAVAVVALGGLLVASLLARGRVRRELLQRGLEKTPRTAGKINQ